MRLTAQRIAELGVALNEATLVGVEVDARRRWAGITLNVLTLPEAGPEPNDRRVQLLLQPIGRIAASLRHGNWDDETHLIEPFGLERLTDVVAGFEQQPIYGWEFIDVPEDRDFAQWSDRLSLDWRSEPGGCAHTLALFQEGGDRHLDLCFWFDELRVFDASRNEIPLEKFVAGGRRWWDGLYRGDERTAGHGIVPAPAEEPPE